MLWLYCTKICYTIPYPTILYYTILYLSADRAVGVERRGSPSAPPTALYVYSRPPPPITPQQNQCCSLLCSSETTLVLPLSPLPMDPPPKTTNVFLFCTVFCFVQCRNNANNTQIHKNVPCLGLFSSDPNKKHANNTQTHKNVPWPCPPPSPPSDPPKTPIFCTETTQMCLGPTPYPPGPIPCPPAPPSLPPPLQRQKTQCSSFVQLTKNAPCTGRLSLRATPPGPKQCK